MNTQMRTAPDMVLACGFWTRFKGLMFAAPLPRSQALLIPHCTSVHTCFMRYALDLVSLDESGRVVKLARNVPPWRMAWGGSKAFHTLEMAAGGIDHHGIEVGDAMAIEAGLRGHHAA
ncbi:MAG: DUF192 domain-containing protein [Comamonadaceae bacterium]|nr:MAG: DUF192 domain-containing protein [Comamonadaceae bacterium]